MAHACPYTITAGSYVLRTLSARENEEFRLHTLVCRQCRREIAELTPSARLLEAFKFTAQTVNGHTF